MSELNLRQVFRKWLTDNGITPEHCTLEVFQRQGERFFKFLNKEGIRFTDDREAFIRQMHREFIGYGPIQQFFDDPSVSEIMINGPACVFVEHRGMKTKTNVIFDSEQHLRHIVDKMIRPSGRKVDEVTPYVDFSLPDGSRVNVTIPPVGFGGPYITVRKFTRVLKGPMDLVQMSSLDQRMAQFLTEMIHARKNILFSGGTGSGKTTLLELLSAFISPHERIIILEDTPELQLRQDNVVRMLTRDANIEGRGQISLRDLLKNSLRMRPTRIIMGEIRGEEAFDYLLALNSGHDGSLSVIHASNPPDALARLESLALLAGLNMPLRALRQQVIRGLHFVVQLRQYPDGIRRVSHISKIDGLDANGEIVIHDLFYFREAGREQGGKVIGQFCTNFTKGAG